VNRLFLALLLTKFAFADDFLSQFEYGQMFYENPRGVSCAKCHGKLGEGAYIGEFIDSKGNKHTFSGPNITKNSFEKFAQAISKGGNLMPRYYLTNKEIKAIYEYIKIVNLPQNKKEYALDRQESYEGVDFTSDEEIAESKTAQNSTKDEKESQKPIEINSSSKNIEKSDDIAIQDTFNADETIYHDEIESDDNNKDSIISTIFNSLEEEGD